MVFADSVRILTKNDKKHRDGDSAGGSRAVATGGGVYRDIYPPKSVYLKFFYVVVLSPCND